MKELLKKLLVEPLSEEETFELFNSFMSSGDDAPGDASIGAYLFSTSQRLLTADELVGGVRSLRSHMIALPLSPEFPTLLDTCGTGGSGLSAFNTSTASAFVCAAAGQPVAKHGNRAASSKCGSADVLEALGVNLQLTPEQQVQCLKESGFCFMFAPFHHPATKRVVMIRRELGIRTIFNFLGPLCNPASSEYQVVGVSERRLMKSVAEALKALGSKRALVVRGKEGLDEISLCGPSEVIELKNSEITQYEISPEDVGLSQVKLEDIQGFDAVNSASTFRAILSGQTSPYADLVALNAGAGLYLSGKTDSIKAGVALASAILLSKKGLDVLDKVIELTSSFK